MCKEGVNHGADVVEQLGTRYSLGHLHAKTCVRAHTAGRIYIKRAVLACDKAQVTDGGVGDVARMVGKADLELAGHLDIVQDGQQVIADRVGVGHDVEGLARLYTGKRGCHDVAGMVTAAAAAENTVIERLGRQLDDLLRRQVVQLDGLAGGHLHRVDAVSIGRIDHKGQLVLVHASAGHAQTQHAALAVALGITAEAARNALVGLAVDLSGVVLAGGIVELFQVVPESLNDLLLHK